MGALHRIASSLSRQEFDIPSSKMRTTAANITERLKTASAALWFWRRRFSGVIGTGPWSCVDEGGTTSCLLTTIVLQLHRRLADVAWATVHAIQCRGRSNRCHRSIRVINVPSQIQNFYSDLTIVYVFHDPRNEASNLFPIILQILARYSLSVQFNFELFPCLQSLVFGCAHYGVLALCPPCCIFSCRSSKILTIISSILPSAPSVRLDVY